MTTPPTFYEAVGGEPTFRKLVAAFYEGPEDKPVREAWVEGFRDALRGDNHAVYVNFVGDEGEARVHDAYPAATWERLARIKAQYDPENMFRLNQNIAPN